MRVVTGELVTVELTKDEINLITILIGRLGGDDADRIARDYNIKLPNHREPNDEMLKLYQQFKDISDIK